MMRLILVAAGLAAGPSVALAEPLELVCQGTASYVESQTTFGHANAYSGGQSASANGQSTTYRRGRSDASIRIRLDGEGGGKVKLAPVMIPALSIGKDGWWDFVKLEVNDDVIKGQLSLNLVNHPVIVIDRHTGEIDLKEYGGRFNGSCEKVDMSPESRKF